MDNINLNFMQIVSSMKGQIFVFFFLFFPENRIWHFMQIVSIVSIADN